MTASPRSFEQMLNEICGRYRFVDGRSTWMIDEDLKNRVMVAHRLDVEQILKNIAKDIWLDEQKAQKEISKLTEQEVVGSPYASHMLGRKLGLERARDIAERAGIGEKE